MERFVAEGFGAPSFDSLGNGSYINFVTCHKEVVKTLGGELIGASSRLSQTQSFGRQLLNIMHQMNAEYTKDEVSFPDINIHAIVKYKQCSVYHSTYYLSLYHVNRRL